LEKDFFTRRTVSNVTYLVDTIYAALEIKNARNFMEALYQRGEITAAEFRDWKKKVGKID
jgi:hypothetical protein